MDPQEQLAIGRQAEEFLQYISDHPYFEGLLERVKLELASQIIGLHPHSTDTFSDFRNQMIGVDQIVNAVHGDIFLGGEAFKQLNGIIDDNKGLL